MILYLMRHGQTDWNLEHKVQGFVNTSLNETGILQAKAMARKLKKENVQIIYASDLKRTRKTADIISAELDVPVHFTKRLREMNFGKAEGTNVNDLAIKFPYIFQAFNDIHNPERYDIGYPNGETIGDVQQRFMKFITKLLEEKDERVLLVTHGMLVRIFTETCFKKTIRLNNGEVLKVIFNEKTKKFNAPKVLFKNTTK